MIIEELNKWQPDETSLQQMAVFMYELGDMVKMFFYAHQYHEPTYLIEAKISLSDLLAQTILLCEREGWNFEEVRQLGVERCIERIQRHISHGE